MVSVSVKIAVATKGGMVVDQIFGHAREYLIYDVGPEHCRLLERRDVENYCRNSPAAGTAMAKILATLTDCQAVLVAAIGQGSVERLRGIGVDASADYANQPVEQALRAYVPRLATLRKIA